MNNVSLDDILVWPNGDWCYRGDYRESDGKSDDYQVYPVDTHAYKDFCINEALCV